MSRSSIGHNRPPEPGDIEQQRLALEQQKQIFEQQKQALEEQWRKRTYSWSIASTLVGAVVSIVVALIAGAKFGPHVPITNDQVERCHAGLDRLVTLANGPAETVEQLRAAIVQLQSECGQTIFDMMNYLAGRGS
jgi:hypothetical protein